MTMEKRVAGRGVKVGSLAKVAKFPDIRPSDEIGSESVGSESRAPHPTDPNRYADGTVRPGNSIALRHGARRQPASVDPESSELFAAWAADLGGRDQLTAGERAVLRRVAEADSVCRTAFSYLSHTKARITSPRVQKALQVLAAHSATVFRGASLLGLERRTKQAPSLSEYLAQRPRTAARSDADPAVPPDTEAEE